MAKRHQFTTTEQAEIESAYKNNRNAGAEPRLKALRMYSIGKSVKEISAATGLSQRYIPTLVHRYRKNGIAGSIGDPSRSKQRHIAKRHTFTEAEAVEIERAYKRATEIWALKRLKVLWLRAIGKQDNEITEATGYSGTSIRRLIREYETHGLEYVASLPRAGKRQYEPRNYKFTAEQLTELQNGYQTTDNKRIKRKIKVLLLRSKGITLEKVANETGLSKAYIDQIIKLYRQNGLAALSDKPRHKKDSFLAFKHKFTEANKTEIEAARKELLPKKAAARLEVLWLRSKEKSYQEISDITGFHPTYISAILRKYHENGLEAIIGEPRQSSKPQN